MFVLCYVTVTAINNGHGHTRYVILRAIHRPALRDDIHKPATCPVFSNLPPALFFWLPFYSLFRYSDIFILLNKSLQTFFPWLCITLTHIIFCTLEPTVLYKFLFKNSHYIWSHGHQHRNYKIEYHADWALRFPCLFFFCKFFRILYVVFLGLTSTTLPTLFIIKCVVMQKFENRFSFLLN